MKLIGNNGEVLAEWEAFAGKRNLYCRGGFGLMLTKKALDRCVRADDVETIDMFKSPDPVPVSADVSKEPDRRRMYIDTIFDCLMGEQ